MGKYFIVVLTLISLTACQKENDPALTYDPIFPSEITFSGTTIHYTFDRTITISYQGDLISEIVIEQLNVLIKEPNVITVQIPLHTIDTYEFTYQDGKLSAYKATKWNEKTVTTWKNYTAEYKNNRVVILWYNTLNGLELEYDGKGRIKSFYENVLGSDNIARPNYFLQLVEYSHQNNVTKSCDQFGCQSANEFDENPNPFFSINYLLGIPFYTDLRALSFNNPEQVNSNADGTKALSLPALESWTYDTQGRPISMGEGIVISYR